MIILISHKKGKGHHLCVHKKKGEVKTFKPTAIAIFKNGKQSKPESEKVHVVAETKSDDPVNLPPVAVLAADKIEGIAPLTVTFDSSASTDDVQIIKRDYEFAPNTYALNAGASATYTYNTPGTYQAKVTITDGEGLTSVASISINVTAPQFLTPPIAWFLIDIDPDTFEVRLLNKAEKGSSNINTVSYELNGSFLANGVAYPYSEVSFQGEFGQTYQIRQIVTDEQNQTDDQIFTIVLDPDLQKPIANFKIVQSNALTAFVDATRSFDPFDQITSIQINWGDGSPVETLDSFFIDHQYLAAGTYNVTLRVETESGQFATRTRSIAIISDAPEALPPIANFNVEYEDHAKHVRLFSEYSGSPNGEILSYFWEYGDGQVGHGEQSVHFYSVGVYYARLTVTDSMNLRASQVQQIIITEDGPPIISSVSCDTFENFATCDFFAAHKDKQLDRVEINWGDNSPLQTIATSNPEWEIFSNINHQYQTEGFYTVSIRAVTSTNLDYVHETEVEVTNSSGGNLAPYVALNCYVVEYTRVQCDTFGSFDPDGFIASTEISMGDGTTYNQSFVEHTYLSGGSYLITVKITDNLGLESIKTQTINVLEKQNEAPIITLNCDNSAPRSLSCNAEGTYDIDGTISFISIKSDDLNQVKVAATVESEVSFSYPSGGNKSITILVRDNEGRESVLTQSFEVLENLNPIAELDCQITGERTVTCDAKASFDPEGEVLTYKIQYDLETSIEGAQSSHTFYNYGPKAIILTVTDQHGFFSEKRIDLNLINLIDSPVADFYISINHDTKEVEFDGSASLANGKVVTEYGWDFESDGIIDLITTDIKIKKTFDEFKTYTTTLTVKDLQARTNIISKDFTIKYMPVPDPGAIGKGTPGGVDSDNDGLRDDIQRWIIEHSNDPELTSLLRIYAKLSQELIEIDFDKTTDPVVIIDNFKKQIRVQGCILKISDNKRKYANELSSLTFNTRERFLGYLSRLQFFSGQKINGADLENNEYCQ
ncbi:MAG: hypothetical protein OHK0056_31360 [Bacteriovoracaceae bacterium]